MPRIINLLSKVVVSPLKREASLLPCKTSFSQADKKWWQPLSNLPSPANFKSPPDHCFPSLPLLLTLSAQFSQFVYSSPNPSLVFTQPQVRTVFGYNSTNLTKTWHLSCRSWPARETPRQRKDSHQQVSRYHINDSRHSKIIKNNNMTESIRSKTNLKQCQSATDYRLRNQCCLVL